MDRRRKLRMVLVLALAAGVGYTVWHRARTQQGTDGYTDLATALARLTVQGWTVEVPPKREGPYRLVPGEPMFGRGEGVYRIRDATGAVTEEITLKPAGYEQAVVHLDTPDGRQTMAVLKRGK